MQVNKLNENLQRLENFAKSLYPSKKLRCRGCDRKFTHPIDTETIEQCGLCFKCDELSQELRADAMADAVWEMESMGLDPEDDEDRDTYFDMVQERDY